MVEKQKLLLASESGKKYVVRKKGGYKKRQHLFVKRRLLMLDASSEIAFVLGKKDKPFSDGEDIVKPCLHKISK